MGQFLRRNTVAGVRYGSAGNLAFAPGGNPDRGAFGAVLHGVVGEVAHGPEDQVLIGLKGGKIFGADDLKGDAALGGVGGENRMDLIADVAEMDRGSLEHQAPRLGLAGGQVVVEQRQDLVGV